MLVFSDMETFLEDFSGFLQGRDEGPRLYSDSGFLIVYEPVDDHYGSTRKMWAFLPLKFGCSAWIGTPNLHFLHGTGEQCTILFSRRRCCRSGITRHCSQEMRMITRGLCELPFCGREAASHGGDGYQQPVFEAECSEYRKVAEYIREVVRSKNGNYIWCSFLPTSIWSRSGQQAVEELDFPAVFWCRDRE